MSQLPPDELPEDTPSHNESKPNGNGANGRGHKSANDRNGGSHEPPTNRDLGLPENYDHEDHSHFIPSSVDLQNAAIDALDREYAFVILNHDKPEKIVERLDEVAAIALVASEVNGNHQAKAIKLGLALELQYWLAGSRADQWERFITTLLTVALRLKGNGEKKELLSRIYHAWSIYGFISESQSRAKTAILAAAEWIQDTEREDISLLIRAERFNMNVAGMDIAQAFVDANTLLADARRLNFLYIQGRVYLSLALAYRQRSQRKLCFAYAQQALVFFMKEDIGGLEAHAVSIMLGVLLNQKDHSTVYSARLLAHLETLVQRHVNPWFQFMVEHQRAMFYFQESDYEHARQCALKAWAVTRKVKVGVEGVRPKHLLGLIQTKRHCWKLAEIHLKASGRWYENNQRVASVLDTKHALAFIPYEQGNLPRALDMLKEVLAEAQNLEESVQGYLVALLKKDIEDVSQELSAEQ